MVCHVIGHHCHVTRHVPHCHDDHPMDRVTGQLAGHVIDHLTDVVYVQVTCRWSSLSSWLLLWCYCLLSTSTLTTCQVDCVSVLGVLVLTAGVASEAYKVMVNSYVVCKSDQYIVCRTDQYIVCRTD